MKMADYYVTHSSEIDLAKCTVIPEAPRIQAKGDGDHSGSANETERPSKLVGSPKKSPTKKGKKTGSKREVPSRAAASAAATIKNEKALFSMNPR
jgi:hypothetical protein